MAKKKDNVSKQKVSKRRDSVTRTNDQVYVDGQALTPSQVKRLTTNAAEALIFSLNPSASRVKVKQVSKYAGKVTPDNLIETVVTQDEEANKIDAHLAYKVLDLLGGFAGEGQDALPDAKEVTPQQKQRQEALSHWAEYTDLGK